MPIKGAMDEKHERKFEYLQTLVGQVTLGDHMADMKTSFDFSGKVEIRMGLSWESVFVALKGHFIYIWTDDTHTGQLHQVFPIIRAGVDIVARDSSRTDCVRVRRGKLMLVFSCSSEGNAAVWQSVLECSANCRHAKKALRKAVTAVCRWGQQH
eukprot:TRINITY_DN11856_c0_g1_i2.p1 TRINITY_DN11856_c0_g1~~TRINITY_DN11856_c0_g1_i2.p1  ORF type:complete len:154 (-),score=39.21 TRINITY_DN11856_c0_g1_i2:337-798(-)